jgi:hypothetical protein
MRGFTVSFVLLAITAGPAMGQGPARSEFPVVKLTARPVARLPSALQYTLLPQLTELRPGNAAPMWLRASRVAQEVRPPFSKEEWLWDKDGNDVPLADLPRKRAREVLNRYRLALELADLAARRAECDWDLPPLATQDFQQILLLEVQSVRLLADLLRLKVRLDIAGHRYAEAIHSLQTGFALARHVGGGPSSLHALVGLAVTAIMTAKTSELIQQPDAPLLFWALTALPRPFIDLRQPLAGEMAIMGRSFPFLSGAKKTDLSAAEAEAFFAQAAKQLNPATSALQNQLMMAGMVVSNYSEARKALLAQGRSERQIDALPQTQVVAIYLTGQFSSMADEILKWIYVPYWQGRPAIEEVQKRYGVDDASVKQKRNLQTVLFGLAVPAFAKVYYAGARTDHQLAGLRCAEAIRLHAATRDGKPPNLLADIKELPLPIDPATGRGMDAWYKLDVDGTGVLEVPPIPPVLSPLLGRRYEVRPGKD